MFTSQSQSVLILLLSASALFVEGKPYAYARWFDYDDLPVAKPVQSSESSHMVMPVNPLRPYEPWILECIVFPSDKIEPGKRHERCQLLDESNEKEYARYMEHVKKWEEAYPERAARWNERFPQAKADEKKKYEQLKAYAKMHRKNDEDDLENDADSSASTSSNMSVICSPCSPVTTVSSSESSEEGEMKKSK